MLYGANPSGPILLEDANDLAAWRMMGGIPHPTKWIGWLAEEASESALNSML